MGSKFSYSDRINAFSHDRHNTIPICCPRNPNILHLSELNWERWGLMNHFLSFTKVSQWSFFFFNSILVFMYQSIESVM